jgi:hypothetical protein
MYDPLSPFPFKRSGQTAAAAQPTVTTLPDDTTFFHGFSGKVKKTFCSRQKHQSGPFLQIAMLIYKEIRILI